jgi:hypothetical protein
MKTIRTLLLAAGFGMLAAAAMADPPIPTGDEVQYTFTRLSPGNAVTFVFDSPTFIDVTPTEGDVFTPTSCTGCADFNNGTATFAQIGSFDDVQAGGEGTLFLSSTAFTTTGVHNSFNPSGATLDVEFVRASVPEPASWALMLAGFGGMGLMLRQAKRKSFARALAG